MSYTIIKLAFQHIKSPIQIHRSGIHVNVINNEFVYNEY
jgi:hypothetical protein